MNATLLRHPSASADCTLGTLVFDNGDTFQTLELPWRDNKPNVSCIPQGYYDVVRHKSPSKGDCYEVLDVPAREHILIHVGNFPTDTQGCILIGIDRKNGAIQQSKLALQMLKLVAPEGFRLRIITE